MATELETYLAAVEERATQVQKQRRFYESLDPTTADINRDYDKLLVARYASQADVPTLVEMVNAGRCLWEGYTHIDTRRPCKCQRCQVEERLNRLARAAMEEKSSTPTNE